MAATANIQLVGTSSLVSVDSNTDKALFVDARTAAVGTGGGVYAMSVSTGSIAATLAANAAVLTLRWTHPTMLCLIRKIYLNAIILTTVTAAVRSNWVARCLRDFIAPDSAQTQISINTTPHDQKFRTSMGPSQFQLPDLRVASTGAITAGTRIRDTNMVGQITGNIPASAAAGTWLLGNGAGLAPLLDKTGVGDYPLVLSRFEGIAVENELTGPATGTFAIVFRVEWQEVPAY